mgnify:FL=1
MKSIRTNFISTYLSATIVAFLITSAVSFYYIHYAINFHSSQAMNFLADEKAYELNNTFFNIERAVIELNNIIITTVDFERFTKDKTYAKKVENELVLTAQQFAKILGYVKTFYFCPNPEFFPDSKCIYYMNNKFNSFIDFSFDLKTYEETDVNHVGWYYKAKEEGKPLWVGPYKNFNIDHPSNTISFATPMYIEKTFIGVVGMEIEEIVLRRITDSINYENGFGFLVANDGSLIFHKDFPGGLKASDFQYYENALTLQKFFTSEYINTNENYKYKWQGKTSRLTLKRLGNDMIFALSIPEVALLEVSFSMIFHMTVILIIILAISLIIVNQLATHIITPLTSLTETTGRIARGELNTEISYKSNNEIGILAESIRKISIELKEYISYIRTQAYTDAMTGSRNKAAYMDRVKILERRTAEDMAEFTVYIFDVNGLKRMNDTYGHEYGDMLIKDSATILRSIFKEENIFRTGGDEFVVIEESTPEEKIKKILMRFDNAVIAFNRTNDLYTEELAISKGAATFNKELDANYKSVFDRADKAMYACKEEYYRTHNDRRRTR